VEVEENRPPPLLQGVPNGVVHLVAGLHADALAAVRVRQLHEVRRVLQVYTRIAAVPEQVLPLPDHAEIAVVHARDDDPRVFLTRHGEFLEGHLQPAVADDGDDRLLGAPYLRPDRGRKAVPHRAQTAGGEPRPWAVHLPVLRRPHLVLADIRRHDGLALRHLVDALDDELRLQVLTRPRAVEGVVSLPLIASRVPHVSFATRD